MLIVGFRAHEMERLSGCLARLMPHVKRDEIAITGGVAIQLGLAAIGHRGSRTTIVDLDLISKRLDSVLETVSSSFLVSHYHVLGSAVDPKHDLDARALGAIFRREVPAVPADLLVEDVYGGNVDLVCQRCGLSRTRSFPLAPKDQIFDLLGYV